MSFLKPCSWISVCLLESVQDSLLYDAGSCCFSIWGKFLDLFKYILFSDQLESDPQGVLVG